LFFKNEREKNATLFYTFELRKDPSRLRTVAMFKVMGGV
jgi:hypothetical protein